MVTMFLILMFVEASTVQSFTLLRQRPLVSINRRPIRLLHAAAEPSDPGMAEAFRQLDELTSLGATPTLVKSSSIQVDEVELEAPPAASLEDELQTYKHLVQELESSSGDQLYEEMLSDMGEEGGRGLSKQEDDADTATQAMFQQAMQQALLDAKAQNPNISAKSVLDDQDIMKEIEDIFDKANRKLMDSLEEIRSEQRELAQASASQSAQAAVDVLEAEARRLEQAEASMQAVLDRVNKETLAVSRAVQDLKDAQSIMDQDLLVKLKTGGMLKQGSFIGLVLFAIRAAADATAAIGNNDPTHWMAALIQAGIAVVCAAIFFLW